MQPANSRMLGMTSCRSKYREVPQLLDRGEVHKITYAMGSLLNPVGQASRQEHSSKPIP